MKDTRAGHDGVAQPSERITCTRCGSTDKGVRLALSTYPLIICSDLWHGVAQPESLSVQPSPQPRCDHDPYDICDNCADGESEQGVNVQICPTCGSDDKDCRIGEQPCNDRFHLMKRIGKSSLRKAGHDFSITAKTGQFTVGPEGPFTATTGVASPSAALSADWIEDLIAKYGTTDLIQMPTKALREAYAAYSGSQEPDWHAFYTDSETRRFAAEEKILALEKQLDSGSKPTAPEPHAANNWRMWNEMLMIAQEHARTALNKLGQTEEQIVSLTEQIKAKDEHSEELQKYVVSLTQERDNWKMKCEQLQFAVKHYSGPTTEGVGMQAKPSAAKSERTK
jgi:hypothetical protein